LIEFSLGDNFEIITNKCISCGKVVVGLLLPNSNEFSTYRTNGMGVY